MTPYDRQTAVLDVAREHAEVEERAQARMLTCPQCGRSDGMQPYIKSAVVQHGNWQRATFYYLESDTDEDDALYAPCQVCGVAYRDGIPPEYKRFRG